MTQPLPDSIIKIGSEHELVREKFQDLREEVFNSKLFETDSLHDIMQMVAKRVVPLLTMDYPSLNEPLDLYVALRDDITRKYRELNPAVEIVETKPTGITQRVRLLLSVIPRTTSQHSPPSPKR